MLWLLLPHGLFDVTEGNGGIRIGKYHVETFSEKQKTTKSVKYSMDVFL